MFYIERLHIKNFKQFKDFEIPFNKNLNIIVGNNDEGKTTILEAINLVITGFYNGRYLGNDISEYMFNLEVVNEYLGKINNHINILPPELVIEAYLNDTENSSELADMKGKNNSFGEDVAGIYFKISFDTDYSNQYKQLIDNLKNERLNSLPTEFYKYEWKYFSESINIKNSRFLPLTTSFIDSSNIRYRNGSDVYISRILNSKLTEKQLMNLNQAYRELKDDFSKNDTIIDINNNIKELYSPTKKSLSITADMSISNSWEDILITCYDNIPFSQIGKGEQSIIKTNLSLKKNSEDTEKSIITLIEEPENHLAHTNLKLLLQNIENQNKNNQLIITTHSSFVVNKLNISNVIFVNKQKVKLFNEIDNSTQDFFIKLYTYDTLRMILANKIIFVEGPSDDLIVQKCFLLKTGKTADENGIDIISVIRSAPRFLEIAKDLNKKIAVITDNDGKYQENIINRYEKYITNKNIKVFSSNNNDLHTLEPNFVESNKDNIDKLKKLIASDECKDLSKYMQHHKSEWALKIFETDIKINFPSYIEDAVNWIIEEQVNI